MRNPDRLLRRLSRCFLAIAAAAAASGSVAQSAPADAASAAVAAAAAALRPVSGSQKATVEELLRADAEAALRAARGAAEAAAPPAPAPAAPVEPVVKAEPPPKPEPVVVVEAIYGTRTTERDDRMVDLSVDGKLATLRRGDALASFRLIDIDGACAVVVREAAAAKARAKARAKPAAPAKGRRVCMEDARVASPSFDNTLAVGGPAAAMPSPIFRPPVAPGQPIAPTSR